MQLGEVLTALRRRFGFQSSTRLTRFATHRAGGRYGLRCVVSILYEANEVCNALASGQPFRCIAVSILYEANEVCNLPEAGDGAGEPGGFQSSTRLTRFATGGGGPGPGRGDGFNPLRG